MIKIILNGSEFGSKNRRMWTERNGNKQHFYI